MLLKPSSYHMKLVFGVKKKRKEKKEDLSFFSENTSE
jgi:hypothetical protein